MCLAASATRVLYELLGGDRIRELAGRQYRKLRSLRGLALLQRRAGEPTPDGEDGQAQPRPVETGLRTAELVEVTEGLEPNDRVIVTAIQRLRPGLPVEAEGDER